MASDSVLEDRITNPVHLRHGEQQQAQENAADGGAQPVRSAPQPVGDILARVEHAHEPEAGAAR
jgi:hypothetical protein